MSDFGKMYATVGLFRNAARQLESHEYALTELVKNCYDADATRVDLDLRNAFKPLKDASIMLRDNGHGMSREDIVERWMPIGSSKNTGEQYSPILKRKRQGGKGLGRLGAWKIGECVYLATKKKGHQPIGLIYDITKLNDELPLDKIKPTPFDAAQHFSDSETGTILIIKGFNERLAQPGHFCKRIQNELHLLTDPFGDLNDFHITHEPPQGYEKYRDLNIQHVVENALYKGDFTIRQNGKIEGKMENCNQYSTGNGEVKTYVSKVESLTNANGLISDVKVKIRAFNLLKMYTDLCFKVKGLGVLSKEKFGEVSGFRLYKDNIRIQPYGRNNSADWDWLGLNHHYSTVRASSIFKNDQLIASASYASKKNPNLKQPASRRGLEETTERKVLFDVLKKLTMELRNFAGDIPKEKPKELTEPKLTYPRIDGYIGEEIPIGQFSPSNSGGKWKELNIETFMDLRIKKTSGEITGSFPNEVGEYTVEGNASNKYGSSKFVIMLKVEKRPPPKIVVPVPPVPPRPPIPFPTTDPTRKLTGEIRTIANQLLAIEGKPSDISKLKGIKDAVDSVIKQLEENE
jgi:hypothetical protein